jgi:hypothetical protein
MVEIGGRDAEELSRSVMRSSSRASMEHPMASHYAKNGSSSFLPLDDEDRISS